MTAIGAHVSLCRLVEVMRVQCDGLMVKLWACGCSVCKCDEYMYMYMYMNPRRHQFHN